MRKNLLQLTCVFAFALVVLFQSLLTGAFGQTISRTFYVDDDAAPGGSGNSWADAFNSLQAAIAVAVNDDVIWVAKGVYKPGTARGDTFNLGADVYLYGGFAGHETALDQRNWRVNETILSGDLLGNDEYGIDSSFEENSYHVLTILSGASVIDGFIITGGNADGAYPNDYGGGIRIGINSATSPIISNSMFLANKAIFGGAISSEYGSPKILQCIFSGNKATSEGGAIYLQPIGIYSFILNSVFSKNYAGGRGGGIGVNNGWYNDNPILLIQNSILWDNGAGNGGPQISIYYDDENPNFPCNLTISYTNLEGGESHIYNRDGSANVVYQDENCISTPPAFVNAVGVDGIPGSRDDNFHLQGSSPCIDAGSNTFDADGGEIYEPTDPIPLDVDFDLHNRFFDDPAVPDSGSGTAPIIDIGAYERTNVIYVDKDATGNNDGTNWRDAFVYLQDGLSAASSGSEIWVAEGVYAPIGGVAQPGDTPAQKREYTFALQSGVALYGGFNGTERLRSERNWRVNETVLSGSINQKEETDNSYNVVTAITDETAILDGFTIQGGYADNESSYKFRRGAGIHGSNATIANCKIQHNYAIEGGGMFGRTAQGKIFNCRFQWNHAERGGAFHAENSSEYRLINSVFIDNTADMGGAVYLDESGKHLFTNCTFSRNIAGSLGGGIYATSVVATTDNSILWGNTAIDGYELALINSEMESNFSDVASDTKSRYLDNSTLDESHNITSDPNFIDSSGRLAAGSPCIDAGDNTAVPIDSHDLDNDGDTAERAPVDLDGLPRFVDDPYTIDSGRGDPPNYPQIVDMGAYEHQRPPTVNLQVDSTATGANNGSSWADAYVHLQDALLTAQDGDVIWVAAGTYKPTQGGVPPADPRDATFQLKNGVALFGGFPQGGGVWTQRNPTLHETILSGDLNGDDDTDFNNYDENIRHVVTGSGTGAAAVLDGFIVTGGNAGDVAYPADSGGGIYNYLGSPTVRNCIFKYNLAGSRGGAMFNQEYNSTVSDCIFAHNRARNGGAMYNAYSSSPSVTGCTFYFNQADQYGGAAHDVFGSHPTFTDCTFSLNTAGISGGAIGSYAGGPSLVRTILWQNDANEGRQISLFGGSSVTINCSDVEGGQDGILTTGGEIINWGSGNIDANPRFCQPINDIYTLAENSPCSDAVSTCGLIGAWPVGCDAVCLHDIDFDSDVDGEDLAIYQDGGSFDDLADFAREFGSVNCQ